MSERSKDWLVGGTSNFTEDAETAILLGVATRDMNKITLEEHLDELEFLAATAGARTVKRFTQNMDSPHPRTYLGTGKVEQIGKYIENHDVDIVITDDDLSPGQLSRLEKKFRRKVLDRSSLILDIFASRAQTAQAKAQVELAQLQYLLPRLRGLWTHLERQRGGIGMRGPGEKEIETDRRILRDKISQLKKKLEKIEKQNRTQSKQRGQLVRVALVGYTNVGKSTLMRRLSKAKVLAENKLFATLDTTIKKVAWGRMPFLLSDTVGFIRKLPHHLVESFKTTLDEVRESDIILHVIDIAHPQYEDQIETVRKTLKDMDIDDKSTILIFNKMDLYTKRYIDDLVDEETKEKILEDLKNSIKDRYSYPCVFISAGTGENVGELREKLTEKVRSAYHQRYPYVSQQW